MILVVVVPVKGLEHIAFVTGSAVTAAMLGYLTLDSRREMDPTAGASANLDSDCPMLRMQVMQHVMHACRLCIHVMHACKLCMQVMHACYAAGAHFTLTLAPCSLQQPLYSIHTTTCSALHYPQAASTP